MANTIAHELFNAQTDEITGTIPGEFRFVVIEDSPISVWWTESYENNDRGITSVASSLPLSDWLEELAEFSAEPISDEKLQEIGAEITELAITSLNGEQG